MHIIRCLIIGIIVGITIAILLIIIVSSDPTISIAVVGGVGGILISGALVGGVFAMLFQQTPGGYVENLMSGLVLGVIAWVVLPLIIYPLISGTLPLLTADSAVGAFSQLIAYLLQGSVIALLYSFTYELGAKRLGLSEPKTSKIPSAISKRVVILGGGYSGVTAAQTLEDELRDDPSVGIWLISQTNYLLHTPMLSEVSASAVNAQNISPALRSFFRRVQVVQCEVERVDMAEQVVHLAPDARSPHRELSFDHLILTVGSVPNFFGNEDVAAEALTFKSLNDAMLLRNQIIDLFERADVEPDAEKRCRMLTFVVAGGGFAGVELIGGINDFARGILPFYPNIPPEEVQIVLVHSRDTILQELTPSLGKFAQEKLNERGVVFKLGVRVTGAERGAVFVGDEKIPTETFVWTAGNKPNPVMYTLNHPLTKRGQIEVNAELAALGEDGLWAAGDCAQIPDVTTGKFAPPTAQHAVREGKVVGYNIAASIQGKPLKTFKFKALGSLAALGHQLAVAEIMGYRFSGFLAWLMWRAIYISKLPTLDKQVRVGLDWFLDIFFPADIVQTIDMSRLGVDQRSQTRETMMGRDAE